MAGATEMEIISEFLNKVHVLATAKTIREIGKITDIYDDSRILVKTGELVNNYADVYVKRYQVTLMEIDEATLITALVNILDGIKKLNRRVTITDYTKPDSLIHILLVSSNKASFGKQHKKNWKMGIELDVTWGLYND